MVLATCWVHARRKFYEFYQATGLPIADEALRRIAELYAVERRIRGQPAEARRTARQAVSRPLIEAMKPWLEEQLRRLPPAAGWPMPSAMRSCAGRPCAGSWTTVASSSTTTPSSAPSGPWRSGARTTCSPAPTVAGNAGRWIVSLIETARLNGVEPYAYLKDVFERMTHGHPMIRIDDLLPWNWVLQPVNI